MTGDVTAASTTQSVKVVVASGAGSQVAVTLDGLGYWLLGSGGSVTPDSLWNGPELWLNAQCQGQRTPCRHRGDSRRERVLDGWDRWRVFSFGDAQFYGSTGDLVHDKPIVAMTSTHDGRGYWLVASDGDVLAFGDAGFLGSLGGNGSSAVGIVASLSGQGYIVIDSDGTATKFGT